MVATDRIDVPCRRIASTSTNATRKAMLPRSVRTRDASERGPSAVHRLSFQALCYLTEEEALARAGAQE